MSDPANLALFNKELIELAGISEAHFYRLMKNPSFTAKRRAILLDVVKSSIGLILKAAVDSAQIEGRDGQPDRKMLLEMAGLYLPAKHLALSAAGPTIPEGDMPDEELVWFYLQLKYPPALWIPGVRLRYQEGQITPRPPNPQAGSLTGPQGAP